MKIDNSSTIGSIHIDNDDWFPFPWRFFPDLEISESKIIWEEGNKKITLKVKNTGNIYSNAFDIEIEGKSLEEKFLNSSPVFITSSKILTTIHIPSLERSETKEITHTLVGKNILHIPNYFPFIKGLYELSFKVDSENKIKESDESNNSLVLRKYKISVKTSNAYGADTDANVYIKLYGKNAESPFIHINTKNNNFEKGQLDTFEIFYKDIGKIEKIKIKHDNSGDGDSWLLEKVTIKSHTETYHFTSNHWISWGRENVEPSIVIKEDSKRFKYKVKVKTSDTYKAGTRASVFIQLYGENGKTSSFQKIGINPNDFKRGVENTFYIYVDEDIGIIDKIGVRHDNYVAGANWHIDTITINDNLFKINQWIGENEREKHPHKFFTSEVLENNVEMIPLSVLYPSRQTPLKVNFNLEKLEIIKKESSLWFDDEPFLWVYGIHIDCKTLQNNEYVVRIPYPGHNNLGVDLDEGESTYIPADVGHISMDVHELPYIGSISGILIMAFEADLGPSNRLTKIGYEAGAKAINDVIKDMKDIKELQKILIDNISFKLNGEIVYKEILSAISSKIKTKVKTKMEDEGSGWYDFWASSIIEDYTGIDMSDPDDQIGYATKFIEFNTLNELLPISENLKGDGANYKITGSISTETFPTIDKSIDKHRWTFGWSSVEFYTIDNQLYLFLLKEDDGRVDIHKMNDNGTLGQKVVGDDWRSGWTSVKFYEINNQLYLFLLKRGDGSVDIHKMKSDGTVGQKVVDYNWTSGWSSIEFYTIDNQLYLFLLKKRDGRVDIHKMKSDGTVGQKVVGDDWRSGWTSVKFYEINNQLYLFLLKIGDGSVDIHKMKSDGTVGQKVVDYNWTSGWGNVEFFTANNKVYLLLSKYDGTINMHQMNDDGTVGRYIDIRHWNFLLQTKIFKIGYKNFLFSRMGNPRFMNKSLVNIFTLKSENYMSYNSLKNNLKYGDIVLFSGDGIGSGIIQVASLSKWSHIGIVYQEASSSKDVVLLEAVPNDGVRLINLGDKIKNYKGRISVRRLDIDRTSYMKEQLDSLYHELKGRSYESLPNMKELQDLYNLIKEKGLTQEDLIKPENLDVLKELTESTELAKAAFDILDKHKHLSSVTLNKKNLEKLFCSELVAEAYQRMGLLSKNDKLYPSNEYVPQDFASCPVWDMSTEKLRTLKLLKGKLMEEIAIK